MKRHYDQRYCILKADSGHETLDLLRRPQQRNDAVALLLVDHRLPQMNGVETLQAAMKLSPSAKRTLLTASNGLVIPDAVKPHLTPNRAGPAFKCDCR